MMDDDYIRLPPQPVKNFDDFSKKTVVVIGKEHYLICKQLQLDNAPDEDFARILNLPVEKIRFFKYKMQLFEDKIRTRRRAARLNHRRKKRKRNRKNIPETKAVNHIKKKELSAEERFKYARELILQNYSTNEIAKLLRVSERSVTRFRKKFRDQTKQVVEGKEVEPVVENEGPEDQAYSFKFLTPDVKAEKIEELYNQGMAATEIAKVLKISDRSVRRWRIRLEEMKKNQSKKQPKVEDKKATNVKRQKIKSVDRQTVERVKEMLQNGKTNKQMCAELNLEMNIVRKIIKLTLNGTVDNMVDDTLELLLVKGRVKIASAPLNDSKSENRKNADDIFNDDGHWSTDSSEADEKPLSTLKKPKPKIKQEKKESSGKK
jgi:transposase-like protein